MSDMQTFPDTVDEFMEHYKVIDKEGVYMSKGVELVPIFRMKQWFEHSERKKGKWFAFDDDNWLYDTYWCSNCRKTITVDSERRDDIGFTIEDMNYCPNCGSFNGGEE